MIYVIAPQVRVSRGGLDFDNALAYLQDGNIKSAATQVVDRDGFVLFLVQAIGKSRSGRLIDDSQDLQPSNFARLFGRLPLAIVEVCGHRDDGLADLLAQEILGGGLQFLQDHRRNLGRTVSLAENIHPSIIVRSANNLVGQPLHLFAGLVVAMPHEALD